MRSKTVLIAALVLFVLCAARQGSSSGSSDDTTDPLDQLRQQYLKLVEQDVETWSGKKIQLHIVKMEQTLRENEAATRLKEAEDILAQLIEEFPKTRSALKAKAMLETLNSRSFASRYGSQPLTNDPPRSPALLE